MMFRARLALAVMLCSSALQCNASSFHHIETPVRDGLRLGPFQNSRTLVRDSPSRQLGVVDDRICEQLLRENFHYNEFLESQKPCDCVFDALSGGYSVDCNYDYCEKCNDDTGICGVQNSLNKYMGGGGYEINTCVEYTAGRNDTICLHLESDDGSDLSCRVDVSGGAGQCTSCERSLCPDNTLGVKYDCRNIEGGVKEDTCLFDANKIDMNSAFAGFHPKVYNFDSCVNPSTQTKNTVELVGWSDLVSVVQINAGHTKGPYQAEDGTIWSTDEFFDSGKTNFKNKKVANTQDEALYHSDRAQKNPNEPLVYEFPLPSGIYTVALHFCESVHHAPDKRLFNVTIEDDVVLQDYDIVDVAGGKFSAVVETFLGQVHDDTLTIQFQGTKDHAKINAIGIYRSDSTDVATENEP